MARWNALVAAGVLLVGVAEVWLGGAAGGSWAGVLTIAAASLMLLGRRRAPVLCAFGALLCQAACSPWAEPDAVTFGLISMLAWYSVGRWANPRRALLALAAVCVVALGMVSPRASASDWVNVYLSLSLTGFVVPWLVGFLVRTRADAVDRRESRGALAQGAGPESVAASSRGPADLSGLSPREADVFHLLAVGATNSEIAAELFLSVYTVKSHVASILAKLGLRDRVQVVLYAHHPDALGRPDLRRQAPTAPS